MISSVQAVSAAFAAKGAGVENIRLLRLSPENFGDWVVEVQTTIGRFRLIRDRGQVFVDGFNEYGHLIRGDALWPALVPLYRREVWSVKELVEILVNAVREG
jgi:hypothetical protein